MKWKKFKFYHRLSVLTILMLIIVVSGCRKLVEIEPSVGSISEDNVFTNNSTAIASITGIYTAMTNGVSGSFTGPTSISFLAGLSADEFTLYNQVTTERPNAYYRNSLSAVDAPIAGSETWSPLYNLIYRCNAAIEGLTDPSSESLTPDVRQQLLGEARFLRAFFYFYLVNMYGDVPIAKGTDPVINTLLGRSSKQDVYQFIVNDLLEAKSKLSAEYLDPTLTNSTPDRIRPTSWAATSLLSRVFLYMGQYDNSEIQATELISNSAKFEIVSLNDAFLKTSKEAIWQLQPTEQFYNTRDARLFVITTSGPNTNQPVYLSPQLLSAFENGDSRRTNGNWVNTRVVGSVSYPYPYKYKLFEADQNIVAGSGTQFMTEYLMVFRLGEQYLIRAEARIRQNKISEGISDLNVIRTRARGLLPGDLPNLHPTLSQEQAINAVLHERQVELFSEWGHRWFDLKRTGTIDAVMTSVTPIKSQGAIQWRSFQQLYPILQTDLDKAPNLKQNTGY